MEEDLWNDLPEEIWLMIMAMLPSGKCLARMKTVCTQWNELLSYDGKTCCSNSSFLFQFHGTGKVQSWVIEGSGEFYKVPFVKFSADCYYMEAACNHMYCFSKGLNFAICNESKRDWKYLPPTHETSGYNNDRGRFIRCGFDPCSRQCIIVVGEAFGFEIVCYDSQSDSWAAMDMIVEPSLYPSGRGIYSNGRFYWLNGIYNSNGKVVELNISERRWTVIPPPPETAERDYSYTDSDSDDVLFEKYYNPCIRWNGSTLYWEIAGSEGQVILVDKKWGCMWKLGRENTWSRVDINLPKEIYQVSVHSSGWTLVVAQEILLYDENKILARKIGLEELHPQLRRHLKKYKQIYKDGLVPAFLSPFECTKLWWPWRR